MLIYDSHLFPCCNDLRNFGFGATSPRTIIYIGDSYTSPIYSYTDWWFQTCFIFHNIGDVILPIDELHHFSEGWLNHQPVYSSSKIWGNKNHQTNRGCSESFKSCWRGGKLSARHHRIQPHCEATRDHVCQWLTKKTPEMGLVEL